MLDGIAGEPQGAGQELCVFEVRVLPLDRVDIIYIRIPPSRELLEFTLT